MHYYNYKNLEILWGTKQEGVVPTQWNNSTTQSLSTLPPFSQYTHMKWSSITMLKQTHSDTIHVIDSNPLKEPTRMREGDALVCSVAHKASAILTADCLPLVIYDAHKEIYALVHAGWKGTLKGIVKKAVTTLQTMYEAKTNDLLFFVGPSAKACCYEVSSDFVAQYNQDPFYNSCFERRNNRWYFNNLLHNQLQLQQVGISIDQYNLTFFTCTLCSSNYCSYRKDNRSALRNITIVFIEIVV